MEEIINSIMQSPENTNPNVLRGQLEKLATGGSGITIVHNIDGTLDITAGELAKLCYNGVCFIETGPDLEYQPILSVSAETNDKTSQTYYNFYATNWIFSANEYEDYPHT